MKKRKAGFGVFSNGIPYGKWGSGKKTMLVFQGGPGNAIPQGMGFRFFASGFNPFINDYTVYFATRKTGMPEGHTTIDMADDYAAVIKDDFEGHVEVVLGLSFGGMIGQHFAAKYGDLADYIILAVAGYALHEQGVELDTRFATLQSEGKDREAFTFIMGTLHPPGFKRFSTLMMIRLFMGFMKMEKHPEFSRDVLIEAQAEKEHDGRESLKKITKPVLLIGGTSDYYFPEDIYRETARLIPNCTLRLYEGKGHMEAIDDRRFVDDIRAFISS